MFLKKWLPSILCITVAVLVSFDAPAATLPSADVIEITANVKTAGFISPFTWPLLLVSLIAFVTTLNKQDDE